jgi:NADH-quinone oxidoreductase subunit H
MNDVFTMLDAAPVLLLGWVLDLLRAAGVPELLVALTSALIGIGAIVGILAGLFALLSVVERKVLARIQNRYGPNRVGPFGILQPVADGIKMITKEDLVPRAGDPVLHFLAPVLVVVPPLLSFAVLPFGRGLTLVEIESGILLIFALGAVVEVAIFMAGWSSRSKFALLGSMRAIAQVISYELPLVLAATAVVMMAGSLSPGAIVAAQEGFRFGFIPNWFVFTPWGAAAFLLFFAAALAESNRSPFDLPEGESEIVAGHMTEYSGFKYALFFMGEYFGMMAMAALAVTLFFGGWQAPLPVLEFVPSWGWFFLKLGGLLLAAMWVRGTLPRIRIDQLMNLCWKCFIPLGLVILLVAALWHFTGGGAAGWGVSLVALGIPFLFYTHLYNRRFPTGTCHFAEQP